ncbi:MAG: hypothetical protein LBE12_08640 [Planctomycetaceae bacterium]|jgi:hypothetical protein|nr:hypothetical protein [Planctomycetaceae bacterium]
MSGPKVGVVALGGATAIGIGSGVALAAAAVVASPVVFTGLIVAAAVADSHRKKKTAKTTKRGAEKFLNSYQQERNNMIAEIDRSEKPVQSLLSNGETRWNTLKQDLDKIRREVQTEITKLRNNTGMPQTKSEAENSLRQAENLLNEAEHQQKQFVQFRNESNQSFQLARNNPSAAKRTVRQHIAKGTKIGDQAIGTINQAVEKARLTTIQFEETLLIIRQKGAEERKREMLRQNAQSNIAAAKSEMVQENISLINDWVSDDAVQLLAEHQEKAVKAFDDERYEESSLLAQESVAMYRQFFDTALRIKQQFESREIITDAIIAALNDLQYDEPDVNYEPTEGVDNAMLGNITIFAKSKGESGDMRLAIDLDGKVNLDVAEIAEGNETECYNAITNLQSKVAEVVDLQITDWGRAKNVDNIGSGILTKQKVQMHDQVKQRG